MIMDSQAEFSVAQAVTAIGDTASTNVYDMGSSVGLGLGEPLNLVVSVNTTVTSAGAATVQIVLQDSADNSTFTDVIASQAYAKTVAVAGARLAVWTLPDNIRRYVRVAYRIGTAVLTTGKFDAFIVTEAQSNLYPASGFSVA